MNAHLHRRSFLTLLGTTAATWPLAARAQQPRRIGVLMNGVVTDEQLQSYFTTFGQALRQLGWVDGQNIIISAAIEAGFAKDGFATKELVGKNSILEARLNKKGPGGLPWFQDGNYKIST